MAHLITDDVLGAWLIKCNPASNPELVRQLDQPADVVVSRWCVADNYRSRMMKPGDRALLWFSGRGRRVPRGIWGWGQVTGSVLDGGTDGLSGSHVVPLDIPLFRRGHVVSSDDLVEAGVTGLEVQVTPAMSNPSWVTKEQLARIAALIETSGRSS